MIIFVLFTAMSVYSVTGAVLPKGECKQRVTSISIDCLLLLLSPRVYYYDTH